MSKCSFSGSYIWRFFFLKLFLTHSSITRVCWFLFVFFFTITTDLNSFKSFQLPHLPFLDQPAYIIWVAWLIKDLAVITLPFKLPPSGTKWMLKFVLTVIVHLPSCTLRLQDDWIRGEGCVLSQPPTGNTGPGINCWQHWTYHPGLMLVWTKGPQ